VAELRPLAEYGRESVKREKRRDDAKGKPGPLTYEALTLANIGAAVQRAAEKLRLKAALVAKLRRLGRERGLMYRTLVLTGLRRGELAALTWGDLMLDVPRTDAKAERKPAPQPMLTVRASVAKNSKAETLPLRADLAQALRDWRAECGEPENSARVFRVPAELVKILARDLAAAGIARRVKVKDRKGRDRWRIDTRDADGRVIDVHAMRTTAGSFLARGGVAPQTAQRLMRHGDYRTTLKHYTDPRLLDTAAALAALPGIGTAPVPEPLRATGTTDAVPEQERTDTANSLGGLLGGTSLKTAQNGA
jgi:integrase